MIFLTLTLASAGTFLHTGLKLPYYMFFGKDSGLRAQEPPRNMLMAMGLAAIACTVIGLFPGLLYQYLPNPVEYHPYTMAHVTSTLGMLVSPRWASFCCSSSSTRSPRSASTRTGFYRRGSARFLALVGKPLTRFEYGFVGEVYEFVIQRPVLGVARFMRGFDRVVVDSGIVGVGRVTQILSGIVRTAVSGHAQQYG